MIAFQDATKSLSGMPAKQKYFRTFKCATGDFSFTQPKKKYNKAIYFPPFPSCHIATGLSASRCFQKSVFTYLGNSGTLLPRAINITGSFVFYGLMSCGRLPPELWQAVSKVPGEMINIPRSN